MDECHIFGPDRFGSSAGDLDLDFFTVGIPDQCAFPVICQQRPDAELIHGRVSVSCVEKDLRSSATGMLAGRLSSWLSICR